MNGNKRGEIVNPSITLSVLNRFDEEIAPGVSVRVDDPLRFRIALNISGNRRKFMEMFAADHVKAYSHQTRHGQDCFVVSGVVSDFLLDIQPHSCAPCRIESRRREHRAPKARALQRDRATPPTTEASAIFRRTPKISERRAAAPAALERLSNGRWRHDSKHTAVE